jgi:hypothetical protein
MQDLTGLGKLADSKVVNKAYDDALSESMRESGKCLTDGAKAFRLFLAPLQFLAAVQDRLEGFFERVRQRVPENRQVEAAPSIAGPIILSLRYMEDDNPLTELFLNLLTRAVDKERIGEAHPAFVRIIEQLSPDEALLLHLLRDHDVDVDYPKRPEPQLQWTIRPHSSVDCVPFPDNLLAYPPNLFMNLSHLESLNLLYNCTTPLPLSFGPVEHRTFATTEFGKLFIKACVPDQLTVQVHDSEQQTGRAASNVPPV